MQSRFFLSAITADSHQQAESWAIPVCLKTSATPICRILTTDDPAIPIPADISLPIFFANAGARGYYRALYTPSQYHAIVAKAETALTPSEKIGLLGDRWALVRSGQSNLGDYLDLALALKQDPNAAVLDTVHQELEKVDAEIATHEDRAQLNAVIRNQFGPVYSALGNPAKGESFDRQQLRSTLFEILGQARDPIVLGQAQLLAARVFADGNKKDKTLDSALSDSAVLVSAANGDAAFYEKVLAVSQNSGDPGEKSDALRTLARFRDPALVQRTLDYAVSGQVRNQDSGAVLDILLRHSETRDQAWDYIQKNWDKVHAQLTVSSGTDLVAATGYFCSVKQRDEVTRFFATHRVEASARAFAKAIDGINDCIQLRATQQQHLHQWLESKTN